MPSKRKPKSKPRKPSKAAKLDRLARIVREAADWGELAGREIARDDLYAIADALDGL